MKRSFSGSLLIEAVVASVIILIGMFAVYAGLFQARTMSQRNQNTATAISLLQSQMDTDSKLHFASLQPTSPPVLATTALPNSTLTRSITEDPHLATKTITYTVSWSGLGGNRTIKSDLVITANGLNND